MDAPYFFEPAEVPLHRDNADKSAWIEEAALPGEVIKQHEAAGKPWLPRRALFVAGGILSNFPIDVFHDYSLIEPSRSTFGVTLELDMRAAGVVRHWQTLQADEGLSKDAYIRTLRGVRAAPPHIATALGRFSLRLGILEPWFWCPTRERGCRLFDLSIAGVEGRRCCHDLLDGGPVAEIRAPLRSECYQHLRSYPNSPLMSRP
jgi:hypothetical protein